MTDETALREAAEAAMAPEPMGFPKNAPEYMDWQFKVASFEAACTPAEILSLLDTLAEERAARERAEANAAGWKANCQVQLEETHRTLAALAAAQAEAARLKWALHQAETAMSSMLIGIAVHNERMVGKPAQPIEGPTVDALRDATQKAGVTLKEPAALKEPT